RRSSDLRESFMRSTSSFLDELKLRASYGASGNDRVGNFQYLTGYAYGQTYMLGAGPQQGIASTGLANPLLTWEKTEIYNVGIDFSFYKKKMFGAVEAYYRER